jgi:hypothetical protein
METLDALLAGRSTTLALGLTRAGADLVVVGSTASWLRGDTGRPPRDLDVAVRPGRLRALVDALAALGVGAQPALRRCPVVRVPTPWCPLDVFVVDTPPAATPVVVGGRTLWVSRG